MSHNELLVDLGYETFCPDCRGAGMVQDPGWAAWWAEHPGGELPPAGDPLLQTPEEVPCSTCEGHGWRLTDRGAAIIQLIRGWL